MNGLPHMARRGVLGTLNFLEGPFYRLGRHATPAVPAAPREILIWSMDRIGDVQRATPVFRLLKKRYPNARLTAVIAGRSFLVLQHNPDVAELVRLDPIYDLTAHWKVIRALSGRRWDLGLMLEADRYWAKLGQWTFQALGVPLWTGFELGNNTPDRALEVPIDAAGSWVDQFIALAASVGAPDDGAGMDLHLSDEEQAWARDFLSDRGIAPHQPFFLIHPGGQFLVVSRQWPAENYGRLITLLQERWDYPVVVTGVAAERPIIERVAASCPAGFVDLGGRMNLRQLAAVIARSTLCVLNDTGPLHMANALGRPTVAILGPTDPVVVGIPRTGCAVYADLPCRPCAFHDGWKACTNSDQWACLKSMTPEQVMAAVVRHLESEVSV